MDQSNRDDRYATPTWATWNTEFSASHQNIMKDKVYKIPSINHTYLYAVTWTHFRTKLQSSKWTFYTYWLTQPAESTCYLFTMSYPGRT